MEFTVTINGKHYCIDLQMREANERGQWVGPMHREEIEAIIPDDMLDEICAVMEGWTI